MTKKLGLAVLALAGAAPAAAQTVSAANPASVVAALQSAGYKAALDKDSAGDPLIKSAASGANFLVYFYGCEKNKECRSIQFAAGYAIRVKPTPAKINDWNKGFRFGQAFLDSDGDPNISWDVVTEGGMPAPLFTQTLERWTEAMATFQRHVGW